MLPPFISDAKDKHSTFIRSTFAPKISRIREKPDHNWCRNYILFLMSEIMNGWRNICSTFAPKLSCIGGKSIMVGAGIKSSFRCKQIQSGKINICSTLAPKLSLIGGRPDHDWCINEILFPMSKMLHGKRNIRLTLAPNTVVYNLPFLILPMWNSLFFFSFFSFFFFFFLPCQKLGVRFILLVYTPLLTVPRCDKNDHYPHHWLG